MTAFRYKAIDSTGHIARGTMEAPDESEVEARVTSMGLDIITIKEYRSFFPQFRKMTFSRRELINFCFNLEQQMQAGVPIIEGLRDIRDSVESRSVRDVTSSLVEKIEGGYSLSQAMADFPDMFDNIFIGLISAGEKSGKLPDILRSLTEALKWQDELTQQAKRALMYPAFAGAVIAAVIAALMVFLVPELIKFITSMDGELPLHTLMLIALSDGIRDYGIQGIIVIVGSIFLARLYAKRNAKFSYFLDRVKLKLWLYGPIQQKLILSRMTHNFALLYSAGITVIDCLTACENLMGNRVMAKAMGDAKNNLGEGKGLSESFEATGLFPKLVIRMLRIGEAAGALDKALLNVNYFYQRDVRDALAKLESMIGPVLTVILGGMLAWVILSVLGPIYDVISTIKI